MGSPFGAGNSESSTDIRTLSAPVTANEGSVATAIQGNYAQTGGVQLRGGSDLVTGGYHLEKGATLSIYNESPTPTASGELEAYVKSQANTGLSAVVPAQRSPDPLDTKTLAAIGLAVVALLIVLFKR